MLHWHWKECKWVLDSIQGNKVPHWRIFSVFLFWRRINFWLTLAYISKDTSDQDNHKGWISLLETQAAIPEGASYPSPLHPKTVLPLVMWKLWLSNIKGKTHSRGQNNKKLYYKWTGWHLDLLVHWLLHVKVHDGWEGVQFENLPSKLLDVRGSNLYSLQCLLQLHASKELLQLPCWNIEVTILEDVL